MTQMKIGQILDVVPRLPVETSVLIRGNHGIGKSQVVRQLAAIISKNEGIESYPVIDRRLSQTTQGDIIGLPFRDDDATKWCPPDWYLKACREPVVLFLDELNRAETEVMQAAFQIVLDREMNGYRLHEKTRVFSAVNISSRYTVNQIDPALLDRFFVIDLFLNTSAWLDWARNSGIPRQITDFISADEQWMVPPATGYDADRVVPSPRSWEFVARATDDLLKKGYDDGYDREAIRLLAAGFVGNEAAIKFVESLKDTYRYTGEDIFNDWPRVAKNIDVTHVDVMNNAIERLRDASQTMKSVTKKQGENLKKFFLALPQKDMRVVAWQLMARGDVDERLPFLKSINPYINEAICDVFGVPVGEKGIGVLPNVPGFVINGDEAKDK